MSSTDVTYTELDAVKRWMSQFAESVTYARRVHGNKILKEADVVAFNNLFKRWQALQHQSDLSRLTFDTFMSDAYALCDQFVAKGLAKVPVPYMTDLLLTIRTLPKVLTFKIMAQRLRDSAYAGVQLYNQNTTWWQRLLYFHPSPEIAMLRKAVEDAESMATELDNKPPLKDQSESVPLYNRFMKVLTNVYAEAARLYGVVETKETAVAEAKDVAKEQISKIVVAVKIGAGSIIAIGAALGIGSMLGNMLGHQKSQGQR